MRWTKLNRWVEEEVIPYIDLAMAEELARTMPASTQEMGACLAFLTAAMRAGHLFAAIGEDQLYPDPVQLWPGIDPEIHQLIKAGAAELPPLAEIHRWGDRYYFQRWWQKEEELVNGIKRTRSHPPFFQFDSEQVDQKLSSALLLPKQREAILASTKQSLTLISGGPGTGKTFTAGHLIRLFLELAPQLTIFLAAPTGKAALHLKRNLVRLCPQLNSVEAKTLHSLLKQVTLSADLIVVDESSMIDFTLMTALFKAVKPGARLVMLGDSDQLPPVEIGAPFSDMVKALSAITLTDCQRTDLKPLIRFAEQIKAGSQEAVKLQLTEKNPALAHNSWDATPKQILAHCLPLFPPPGTLDLSLFDHFRLLSPMREGLLGVDSLNALFADHFRRQLQPGEPFTAPIMIIRNDWSQELFNGEIGLLISQRGKKQLEQGDYALFSDRRIPALLLPPFDYAYCLSVHKSQGSEFGQVLVVLPPGSERFGRELLYTAVTRAKQRVEIWGAAKTLAAMAGYRSQRLSSLPEKLVSNI